MKQFSISILLLLVLVSVGALSTGCSGLKQLNLSATNSAPSLARKAEYPTFQSEIAAQAPPFEANLETAKVGDYNYKSPSIDIIQPTARFLKRKAAQSKKVTEGVNNNGSSSKASFLFPPVYRSYNTDENSHARTSLTLGLIAFFTAITFYGPLICGTLAIIHAKKSRLAGEPDQKKARAGKFWGIMSFVAIPVGWITVGLLSSLFLR